MKKNKKWKTVFQICYKLYKYLIMLFGLINMLVIFQEFVNNILHDIMDKYVMAYLNNILMFIDKKFNQHKKHIK